MRTRFWNSIQPHKSIIWHTDHEAGTCLPYFIYGNTVYPLRVESMRTFKCDYNPEMTPRRERGVLSKDGEVLSF